LKINEIINISKTKVLGLFDSGILLKTKKNQVYKFASFEDRDFVMKRIVNLWQPKVSKSVYDNNKSCVSYIEGEDNTSNGLFGTHSLDEAQVEDQGSFSDLKR
jgi:hypothetical protein